MARSAADLCGGVGGEAMKTALMIILNTILLCGTVYLANHLSIRWIP